MNINFNNDDRDGIYPENNHIINEGDWRMTEREENFFEMLKRYYSYCKITCIVVGAYTIGFNVYKYGKKIDNFLKNLKRTDTKKKNVEEAEFVVVEEEMNDR